MSGISGKSLGNLRKIFEKIKENFDEILIRICGNFEKNLPKSWVTLGKALRML